MKNHAISILSIPAITLVTVLILMVPLVAMQFTSEVVWTLSDFIIAGAVLFSAGLLLRLVLNKGRSSLVYRLAVVVAFGTMLLMVWANLAVGLIGGGPHAGNLMYAGVVAVVLAGIFLSRFKSAGMEKAMYASAGALGLVAVIALLAKMDQYPGSSVIEILGVNGFFATAFIIAGLLFRFVARDETRTT
jgi:hypothetical protein